MRQKLIVTTLFVLLFIYNSFGQNDWEPGYILSNPNDTIKGYIQIQDSRYNSKLCNFRIDLDGKIQVFSPKDILGYRIIGGKFYISKNIEGLEGETSMFLEFLIQGMVNIYHLKDNESRFFGEKDGKIFELKNTKRILKVGDLDYLRENKEYIGILSYMLKDADMLTMVQTSELTSKSLIQIAKKYHEKVCTNEQCIVYERIAKPVQINFGIYTGLSLNKINFGTITTSDYRMSILLGCRIEFENIFEWAEKLNLIVDLNYHRYANYQLSETEKSSGSFVLYDNQEYFLTNNQYNYSGTQNLDVNIKTNALKVPIVVNYNFSKDRIEPFIGMGLSTMCIISQNKDFIYQRLYSEFNKSIPTFHLGLLGNIGSKFIFKNGQGVFLEVIYEYTQTMNVNQFLRFTDNTFTFSFGYIF